MNVPYVSDDYPHQAANPDQYAHHGQQLGRDDRVVSREPWNSRR
jgi:hypothetical protein